MSEELDPTVFSDAVFIPSHLAKGLFGMAVAVVAGGVAFGVGSWALNELKQVTSEEVRAMLEGVD